MEPRPDSHISHVSHVDLLAHASALEFAAMRDDLEGIHARLCSLRNDLIVHMRAEEDDLELLSAGGAIVVRRGQKRLVQAIDDLLTRTGEGGIDSCTCLSESVTLTRALARQARVEADLLSRRRVRADRSE